MPTEQESVEHRRQIEEDFAVVVSISDPEARADQLIQMAPYLPADLRDQALDTANSISDEQIRARAFVGLAPHLNLSQIDKALQMARHFSTTPFRFEALGAIGRYAVVGQRAQIIEQISNWGDPKDRLRGWLGLIDILDDDKKQDAFATALLLPEAERVNALVKLAPALTPTWKMSALASVRSMTSLESKVRGLCVLIPFLPKREKAPAVDEALSLSRELRALPQAEAVLALLPHLPSELQESVESDLIDLAAKAGPFERIDVLLRLAQNSQTRRYRKVALITAIYATREITDANQKKDELLNIAAVVAPELRGEIFGEANGIEDLRIRSSLLIRLDDIYGPPQAETSSGSESTPPLTSPPSSMTSSAPLAGSGSSSPPGQPIEASYDNPPGAYQSPPSAMSQASPPAAPPANLSASPPAAPSASPPAESKEPRAKGTRKRAKTAPEPAPIPPPDNLEPIGIKTYLHSDKWTIDDKLNYSLYAKAIAEFIRHEDTHPPLAIGILAPWGQGKTSLMRMIQAQLELQAKAATVPTPPASTASSDQATKASSTSPPTTAAEQAEAAKASTPPTNAGAPSAAVDAEPNNAASPAPDGGGGGATPVTAPRTRFAVLKRLKDRLLPPERPRFKFKDLKEWLRNPAYSPSVPTLHYPTVWFNAWKYQNSEQLWAAMAYCILDQLVRQIPKQLDQEKFWLALQAERIDFAEVRRDIHRVIFESVAPWLILWAGFALVGIMLFVIGFALPSRANIFTIAGPATFSVSFLGCVGQWLFEKARVHRRPLEGKFAQYVRQPTYEGKLGFFHEVEQDVRRVFDLLVSEEKPVVIFIDDLDRCSPGTVAQVIEAMNLFLSADFPDCYFVVGMDAQVVAASMEVAYETLDKKLKSVTRSYGSLGWYFMDKFIQLQFNIPNLTKEVRNGYLAKLFGGDETLLQNGEVEKKPTEAELDKIEAEVDAALQNPEIKPEEVAYTATQAAKLRFARPQVHVRQAAALVATGAKQLADDSPVVQKYLDDYKDFLGTSPRAIKRFTNLFRFYNLTQIARRTQGLEASSPAALARWLVIMLRWPQLVRWIQWESETKLTIETDAKEKAAALEKQLCGTGTYEAWLKYLEKMDPAQGEWLRDKHLYEFLKTPVATERKLSVAVKNGVW
jgi:hypothetical protein